MEACGSPKAVVQVRVLSEVCDIVTTLCRDSAQHSGQTLRSSTDERRNELTKNWTWALLALTACSGTVETEGLSRPLAKHDCEGLELTTNVDCWELGDQNPSWDANFQNATNMDADTVRATAPSLIGGDPEGYCTQTKLLDYDYTGGVAYSAIRLESPAAAQVTWACDTSLCNGSQSQVVIPPMDSATLARLEAGAPAGHAVYASGYEIKTVPAGGGGVYADPRFGDCADVEFLACPVSIAFAVQRPEFVPGDEAAWQAVAEGDITTTSQNFPSSAPAQLVWKDSTCSYTSGPVPPPPDHQIIAQRVEPNPLPQSTACSVTLDRVMSPHPALPAGTLWENMVANHPQLEADAQQDAQVDYVSQQGVGTLNLAVDCAIAWTDSLGKTRLYTP